MWSCQIAYRYLHKKTNKFFKFCSATKGSVQQGVHRLSAGHDERLVVIGCFSSLSVSFHCRLVQRVRCVKVYE